MLPIHTDHCNRLPLHHCAKQAYTSSVAPLITMTMAVFDTSGLNVLASAMSAQLKVRALVVHPDGVNKLIPLQVM